MKRSLTLSQKLKFYFKRKKLRWRKTKERVTDDYPVGVTMCITYQQNKVFAEIPNVSFSSSFTRYAYWDEQGYLCVEDTQGFHNSKL